MRNIFDILFRRKIESGVTKAQVEQALRDGTDDETVRRAALVHLASDVILQVLNRKYQGKHRTYFSNYNESCQVCAIGSAIVSELTLSKKKTISDLNRMSIDRGGCYGQDSLFTAGELMELENLFEGTLYNHMSGRYTNQADRALLIIFSLIVEEQGDISKVMERLGPGTSFKAEKIMSTIKDITARHGKDILEGTEACDILKDLKASKVSVPRNYKNFDWKM